MTLDPMQLPDDIATLKAMLIATAKRAHDAETRASTLDAEIENLKLTIAKLQHDKFGTSSERARLLDQLELQLAELEEQVAQNAATDEIAALPAGSQSEPGAVSKPPRRRPARRPLPAHLPRERIIYPPSEVCPCCSGTNFRKLGTDETESLERVPAQWKVVVHVREKFACRKCDTIVQAPAPSHPVSRGRAGPHLLAEIVFGKYRAHQPLNRQSDIYANEGVDIDISTMADWVGACAATLMPIRDAIEKHVHAGERIHIDDTTVPVLAKGKLPYGRLWTHVRDDRPFAGTAAPAAVFYYSPNREGEHPEQQLAAYTGIMQADAYSGFNGLYRQNRQPGPITEAGCWAHFRRKLFELARLRKAPIAIEAVCRIDELFTIERDANGQSVERRLAIRRERSKPCLDKLEKWLREERKKLSSNNPIAKAMDYGLKRWATFTRFLDDGRICMTNNAAERALRGIAVGRRNWTFCGSDSGGQRAAVFYTLIETCRMNDVDPRAWLADVLARIADHPAKRIAELMPWNWKAARQQFQTQAA
ncbi:MAG: IS66 family transposase [Rhodomicrobiaceae bacterium]